MVVVCHVLAVKEKVRGMIFGFCLNGIGVNHVLEKLFTQLPCGTAGS